MVISEVKEENNRQAILGEIRGEVEGPALRRRLITTMAELGRLLFKERGRERERERESVCLSAHSSDLLAVPRYWRLLYLA